MPEDAQIATHAEAANRERSNYIVRLALTKDGMPGNFEQMWTHTVDGTNHELCCIPFFTYGLSLGDVITLINDEGDYRIQHKSGHRTLRVAFTNELAAHENHNQLHSALAAAGTAAEFRGAHGGYGAVDIAEPGQAEAIIEVLDPLAASGVLIWEWADPA